MVWINPCHPGQTVQDNKYRIMDNSTSCRCGPLIRGQKTGLLSLFNCHSSHSVVVSPVISRWLTTNIRTTDWTTERDDAVVPLFPHPVRVVASSHYSSCYSPRHYIVLWFSCHVSLSHFRVVPSSRQEGEWDDWITAQLMENHGANNSMTK